MHRLWLTLFGLAACSFRIAGTASPDGDGGTDADPDALIDALDGQTIDVATALCLTWDPHHFDACLIPAPTMDLDLSIAGTYTLNTTNATLQPPAGGVINLIDFAADLDQGGGAPMAFLVSVNSLTVGAGVTLRVIGTKPLIVASWSAITVAGTIDVGSHLATTVVTSPSPTRLVTTTSAGAGAHPAACGAMGATAGGAGTSGSGGGGGGGFRGAGGAGGRGDTGGPIAGGVGGTTASTPSIVRGGCNGAISGTAGGNASAPATSTTTSPAGPGGGAIQLSARGALEITGTITAGGAGGGPAQYGSACGGGGAGSGGFIGLEGATMMITNGTLAANGGGGGSSGLFAGRGHPGQDGRPTNLAAVGGMTDSTCALQAPGGSAGGSLAGGGVPMATTCDCGGAGGGGGAGFILTWGTLIKTSSTISPADQAGPP